MTLANAQYTPMPLGALPRQASSDDQLVDLQPFRLVPRAHRTDVAAPSGRTGAKRATRCPRSWLLAGEALMPTKKWRPKWRTTDAPAEAVG